MSTESGQTLGQVGEELAADHLMRQGFQILERNFRTRWGELDIVAFDGRALVFCEVKTRRLIPGTGNPFDAVNRRKRLQVRRIAGQWLVERSDHPYAEVLRFDAIGISFDLAGTLMALEHLEGAF
jgi:putative endonuclease